MSGFKTDAEKIGLTTFILKHGLNEVEGDVLQVGAGDGDLTDRLAFMKKTVYVVDRFEDNALREQWNTKTTARQNVRAIREDEKENGVRYAVGVIDSDDPLVVRQQFIEAWSALSKGGALIIGQAAGAQQKREIHEAARELTEGMLAKLGEEWVGYIIPESGALAVVKTGVEHGR
jgi:hypothetical protein